MFKFASLLALALTAWLSTPAHAVSPPPMPLPACVDGEGACPRTNALVTGTTSATLTAGGTVVIHTVPTNGVCDSMRTSTNVWTPSGCYMRVAVPTIVGCAYIDLSDMQFRESSCQQALYKNAAPAPLFTLARPAGNTDPYTTLCGGTPSYDVFFYGGQSNVPGGRWAQRGPGALQCALSMAGERPDGLYGPTWVKISVGIGHGETGLGPGGRSESAEFYAPIDGDLRGGVDVRTLVTHTLSGGPYDQRLTVHVTLENQGELPAEGAALSFLAPNELHVLRITGLPGGATCDRPGSFVGGSVICAGIDLPGNGDALGRNTQFIEIETRIINASDFEGRLTARVQAPDDVDPTNNEDFTLVELNLRPTSWTETAQLLEAIAPYFDYETPDELLDLQCDVYMNDIYARLNAIRDQYPHLFANLAFGRIASGAYSIPLTGFSAGHVGVVVYPKGTNYHQSGLIIHGTPTWSPTDVDIGSRMGTQEMGEHVSINFLREGTADHGQYYRTQMRHFPGNPHPESPLGCGYEGAYAGDHGEFGATPPPGCTSRASLEPKSCPFYPDAVLVRTESPVDLTATNSRGQRVQTSGGLISMQELDGNIFSFPVPHEDGTFGWTLVLPKDEYDIGLTGTGTGPYKLTIRTYDADGKAVDKVVEGQTESGRVEQFDMDGGAVTVPPPPPPSGGGGNGGTGDSGDGGGGAVNALLLLALGALLMLLRAQAGSAAAPARHRASPR